jgi:hypothetical protein
VGVRAAYQATASEVTSGWQRIWRSVARPGACGWRSRHRQLEGDLIGRERTKGGCVINISSGGATRAHHGNGAAVAVFLASDQARYMTDHTVAVVGGLLSQQRRPQVDIFPLELYPRVDRE